MRNFVWILFLVLSVPGSTLGQTKPIDEIKVDKISLGTGKSEFLKIHPKAQTVAHNEAKFGLENYYVGNMDTSIVQYVFLREKMHDMTLLYSKKELKLIGGWEKLFETINKKYGKYDEDSPGMVVRGDVLKYIYLWTSEKTSNQVIMQYSTGGSDSHPFTMVVYSHEVKKELIEIKKKSAKTKLDD